jgi:protein-tyrosine phosphatase
MTVRVLFVCLGNICRSPMAEAVFQQMVNEAGLANEITVDSVGTGDYHIGEPAHNGTRRVLARHNIPYNGRARQIAAADVTATTGAGTNGHVPSTYVIVMDQSNLANVRRRFGNLPHLHRLLDFATETDLRDVPDPYYTGNFDEVFRLVTDGCRGLLATIRRQEGL